MDELNFVKQKAASKEERAIYGAQFRNEDGGFVWNLKTWPNEGHPIEASWFHDGEFHEILRSDILVNMRGESRYQIGGEMIAMDEKKESALREAIRSWESDEQS